MLQITFMCLTRILGVLQMTQKRYLAGVLRLCKIPLEKQMVSSQTKIPFGMQMPLPTIFVNQINGKLHLRLNMTHSKWFAVKMDLLCAENQLIVICMCVTKERLDQPILRKQNQMKAVQITMKEVYLESLRLPIMSANRLNGLRSLIL